MIECSTVHALVFFLLTVRRIRICFSLKSFAPPTRGIIPQNFSSLGFVVSEELGNRQTHLLTSYCFRRLRNKFNGTVVMFLYSCIMLFRQEELGLILDLKVLICSTLGIHNSLNLISYKGHFL